MLNIFLLEICWLFNYLTKFLREFLLIFSITYCLIKKRLSYRITQHSIFISVKVLYLKIYCYSIIKTIVFSAYFFGESHNYSPINWYYNLLLIRDLRVKPTRKALTPFSIHQIEEFWNIILSHTITCVWWWNFYIWEPRIKAYLEENDLWEVFEEDNKVLPLSNIPTMVHTKFHMERKIRKSMVITYLFVVVSE